MLPLEGHSTIASPNRSVATAATSEVCRPSRADATACIRPFPRGERLKPSASVNVSRSRQLFGPEGGIHDRARRRQPGQDSCPRWLGLCWYDVLGADRVDVPKGELVRELSQIGQFRRTRVAVARAAMGSRRAPGSECQWLSGVSRRRRGRLVQSPGDVRPDAGVLERLPSTPSARRRPGRSAGPVEILADTVADQGNGWS